MAGNAAGSLDGLERGGFEVAGIERTYSLAPAGRPDAPILVVLHGAGGTGDGMAALTALHRSAPAAGLTAVFPDGVGHVWNDRRDAPALRAREGVDDVAFLAALPAHLGSLGAGDPGCIALVGMSNGALFAEHLARHELVAPTAVVLVAGPGTTVSRASRPIPTRPTAVMLFHGTADPLVPYEGGPIGPAWLARRRRGSSPEGPARGMSIPAEVAALEWASAGGPAGPPLVEQVGVAGDLAVTRTSWSGSGRPPVVLHRIEGGGHTWPGGPPYLPARLIGPVATGLDASGLTVGFVIRSFA